MKYPFKARIYKTGINWCVDVPKKITGELSAVKGYIRIKGEINGFSFSKSLVPVKGQPYRLFVNLIMMKGGKTALGEVAAFSIQQDKPVKAKDYPMPRALKDALKESNFTAAFNDLSEYRRKEILKYFTFIKTDETLRKNINKLIDQLKKGSTDPRIP